MPLRRSLSFNDIKEAKKDTPSRLPLRRAYSSADEIQLDVVRGFTSIPIAPPLPDWLLKRGMRIEPDGEEAIVHIGEGLTDSGLSVSGVWEGYDPDFCCGICFDDFSLENRHTMPCCSGVYCLACMKQHVRSKVGDGIVRIACPRVSCKSFMPDLQVRKFIDPNNMERYDRLLTIHDGTGNVHLCPSCSKITDAPPRRNSRMGTHVVCEDCNFDWCFECESPWHASSSCKDNRKVGKDFKTWLRTRVEDTPNAQRCPKCKIPIQRSSGCNNMTCSKCHTSFCYRCGGRQHDLILLGDHYSRFSVLGCKYNYMPDKPLRRKAIRGSILVAGVTVGVPLAIGGGALLAAGIVAASPFYGTYKIVKNIKERI